MASLINNLGGTLGFGEYSLTRNDDSYQTGVDLTTVFGASGLNFFGTQYSYVSINNNGNITLSNSSYGGLSTYTPFGLANGGYAIIAPFFADVDTRLSGGIADADQVTPTAGGTSRGSDLVWYDLDPTGYGKLTVTWDDVGYYSYQTDKLNAFQLQIVGQGGGNFDIIFRYESINWTTGGASGGSGGLGGTVARAGYSTGDGASWYELAQSGLQDAMLELESTPGNTGVAGYYKFSVRSGTAAGEVMNGTSRDDLLAGAGGDDTIYGFAGNDYLIGNAGNDSLVGGSGNDTYTTDGFDTIVETADGGTDTVLSSVTYTLGANLENLRLTGNTSLDGTGNSLRNVLAGNSATNTLDGQGGSDTVDYSLASGGFTLDLGLATEQYVSGQGYDTLISIESVIGSIYNDHLTGTSTSNTLNGNLGADTMIGGDGNDTYYVDNIYDVVTETSTGGTDTVNNYLGEYTLGSYIENGRIMSTGAANLTGNELNNLLYAGRGDNVLAGGTGTDTVSYAFGTNGGVGVAVSLAKTTAQSTGGSGSDTLTDIENLIGSAYADKLTGNTSANKLTGDAGNDTLDGGSGIDTMIGGDGDDRYYVRNIGDVVSETNATASTGGTDLVYSYLSTYTLSANVETGRIMSTGSANLTGNSLNNVLYAGTGNNTLSGGSGVDTASYAYGVSGSTGVTVSLTSTGAQSTGGSGSDTLVSIENLIGSAYADNLTGCSGNNSLTGGNGNDRLAGASGNDKLSGGSGNDTLIGGSGRDTMTGGSGNDIFDFNAVTDSGTTSTTWDIIADFVRGQDRIDLSTIDANTTGGANDAFSSTLVSNFTAAGQLKFDSGVLYGNTDGNLSTAEFAIQLTGISTLSAADFIL